MTLDDQGLTVARWGPERVDIVMLHDGLGSISQWRSVPSEVAARTGLGVAAYERAGHGTSTPIPSGPWPADWLHREADRLPRLLAELDCERPLVVGHSDGGSIALIHAAQSGRSTAGVVALAAHSWVEQLCYDSIVEMRADPSDIIAGLSRHHAAPEAVFEAWSGGWVSDQFRSWDIRPTLSTVAVPTVIAQGSSDPYASDDQAHLTARSIGANAESRILPGLGHIMHHDDAAGIAELIADFSHALMIGPNVGI